MCRGLSSNLVDQRQAERMPGRIAEHETVSRVRLMSESPGTSTLDAVRGGAEIVNEKVDVDQSGILGPPRWHIVSNAHEL